ncbi:SCO family protein [Acidovorax kalamii]|uniref:Cytochrome C oxidase subunit I n=1 Tax=Acidovorax kalamii TaxID=2004485 RepID=A0A235EH35_9BURK|nr:hypothetical protein [Acidovorax kalamii]OYD48341.1 hypothetical protein CBY09_20135 [Acidovorax kalamii]
MSGSKSSDGSFARAASLPPEVHAEHPLGLTVHTLPEAGDAVASAQRTRHGRWKMLGVLAICAAPVIASYFTYYVIRPEGRRNYGELIDPQRTLPALTVATPDGAPVTLASLKGQWLLVSVAGGACDAVCQNHLYLQRQLRESLGKEKDRLDWVWLVNDNAAIPDALAPALQKATVLRVDAAALNAWLAPAAGQQQADHLYVVDPMGNWMMRFPAAMDASGAAKAKRDLERLLRASSSWDDAGRPGQP